MQRSSPSVFDRAASGTAWLLALSLLAGLPGITAAGPEARTGAQIYRQQCARCHGKMGEGTDENYPRPLAGERSVAQLVRLISKSMPKDMPQKCVGADAEKVGAYIHEAFYSKAAQARNTRPRIELSRLTVRQYRHTVADLIGSFRSPGQWDQQRGL